MRASWILLLPLATVAACGPGPGLPPSAYAGLPPQDTLAGGLAPAPSTSTGGSLATPAAPNAPTRQTATATPGSGTSPTRKDPDHSTTP